MDQVGPRRGLLGLAEHSRPLCTRQWASTLRRGMVTSREHFISRLALACDWAISSDGKPAKPAERWVALSRDRCVTVANWRSCKSEPLKRYLNRLTVSRWPRIHGYFFLLLSPFLRRSDGFIRSPRWRCIINACHLLFMLALICRPHAYSFQTRRRFIASVCKLRYDVIFALLQIPYFFTNPTFNGSPLKAFPPIRGTADLLKPVVTCRSSEAVI